MISNQCKGVLEGGSYDEVGHNSGVEGRRKRRLTDVEIDFARRAANITKVSVSHFSRSIHDAALSRYG